MSDLAVMTAPAETTLRYADDIAVADDVAAAVLLVDDDMVDRMLIRRSFRTLGIGNPIVEAHDGIAALELLRGRDARQPVVVLLDLHMPRMDGFEFLDEAFADPALPPLLVFVMTTCADDEKRVGAHARDIAGFVPKNAPAQGILMAISMATETWPAGALPN
jgi:CheY-like chemotaxis protein